MPCPARRTAIAACLAALACHSDGAARPVQARGPRRATPPRPPAAEILSCFDLPHDDPRSHGLSGLAWDPVEHKLFALSDHDKWITVIEPRAGFRDFALGTSILLDLDVEIGAWDGEALAIAGDHFLLTANETQPAVFTVDRSGRAAARIDLPFPGIRHNVGLEGIGYFASAAGRFLFAVNEEALEGDGDKSTAEHGTVVRILRRSLDGGGDLQAAYLTDPVFADGSPGDNGVSDLAAISPDRLLVMERGYVGGKGNAVRVYEVDLRGAQNIVALGDARAAVPVRKRLVFDLALVSDAGCSTPPRPQRSRTLENYEGITLGPTLEDGRRVVFLVSDDNLRANQVPRLIALALAPGSL